MSNKTRRCLGAVALVSVVLITGLSIYSIAGGPPLPDLVVKAIDFKKVSQQVDVKGNKYWIFNVYITIANNGKGDAGSFQVLLTRNNGDGGSFVQACSACWPTVASLLGGTSYTLPPFQFNNANGMNSTFNAKADYPGSVVESNETNNTYTATFSY